MSAGMEAAPPRVGPVAFGERIIPRGMEVGIRFPSGVGGIINGNAMEGEGDSSDDDVMDNDEAGPSISLPLVVPASADLASAIKIGKLENGNLVVQELDDSDESDVEEREGEEEGEGDDEEAGRKMEHDATTTTDAQRSARAQAAEERRARRAMIEKLRKGDIAQMIKEEKEREEEMVRLGGGGYVEPPRGEPPVLGTGTTAAAAAAVVVPKPKEADTKPANTAPSSTPTPPTSAHAVRSVVEKQPRLRDIVQKDVMIPSHSEEEQEEAPRQQQEQEPQPNKKMSKFKAARLARG